MYISVMREDKKIIAWWSAGITSAVACKFALELYDNVELYYIDTGAGHEDNKRFIKDCENWYGMKITQIQSEKYKDQFDVIEKIKYVNGVAGAPCTLHLKKNVRFDYEKTPALLLSKEPPGATATLPRNL